MIYLRSFIFYIFLALWTVFIFVVLSPLFLTFKRSIVTFIGLTWSRVILMVLKILCKLDYRIEGIENICDGSAIIACKHQSMWETVFLTYYLPQAKYILKKELTKIPFYGWYLILSGMIHVDRKLGLSAIKKVIRDTTNMLNTQHKVIIFPQGTRVGVYEDKPYQSGVAAIHFANPEIPIIPCALNSRLYWPKGLSLIKNGTVVIKFLKPIQKSLRKEELMSVLKTTIDEESLKLIHHT